MASATIHAFLEFFLLVLRITLSPSHWLLSNITTVETMESGKGRMNIVATTVINQKEYWPSRGSNQPPFVLKSATLPTEQWNTKLLIYIRILSSFGINDYTKTRFSS